MTKRITVPEVIAAYEKTGLAPVQDVWLDPDINCACGLGVLYVAAEQSMDFHNSENAVETWANTVYNCHYVNGFQVGFDGYAMKSLRPFDEQYTLGYADGRAAWEAVKPCESVPGSMGH